MVDEIMELKEAVLQSDLIILATPINAAEALLPDIMKFVGKQVIMDVGSTKKVICESAAKNNNRGRFVATHPIVGTRIQRPRSCGKRRHLKETGNMICSKEDSDSDAVALVEKVYDLLGMHLVYMNAG